MKTILGAVLAALVGVASAEAATISETTDLPGTYDALQTFLTATSTDDFSAPGAYEVTGTLSNTDEADIFTAVLGPDRIIENIFITFANVGGDFGGSPLNPDEIDTLVNITVFFPTPAGGTQGGFSLSNGTGDSALAFGSGVNSLLDDQTYIFGLGIAANSLFAAFGTFSADWTVTFDVIDTSNSAAVPLPASAALLITAMAGMAGLQRRRRA